MVDNTYSKIVIKCTLRNVPPFKINKEEIVTFMNMIFDDIDIDNLKAGSRLNKCSNKS